MRTRASEWMDGRDGARIKNSPRETHGVGRQTDCFGGTQQLDCLYPVDVAAQCTRLAVARIFL